MKAEFTHEQSGDVKAALRITYVQCPKCQGRGMRLEIEPMPCHNCNRTGYISSNDALTNPIHDIKHGK